MTKNKAAKKTRRVTMKDVARDAGVSQTTVSFVLNNREDMPVADNTRERVLASAKALDFRPNQAARSLRSQKPFTVGVVTKRIVTHPYAGNIMLGIQQSAQTAGYLCSVVEISDAPDGGQAAIDNLLQTGVAGLIFVAPGPEPLQSPLAVPENVRVVYVNCWPSDTPVETSRGPFTLPDAHLVLADEFVGGREAARTTFSAGHRSVAFIGGPESDYACRERLRGLIASCHEAEIDPSRIPRFYGQYNIATGYSLALAALSEVPYTALICGNDRMAVGALVAIHELGLRCPDDVSLVGFDDQPDIAGEVHPQLTTVALPHLEMGQAAAKALLNPEETPNLTTIPCRFVARDSLRPPTKKKGN